MSDFWCAIWICVCIDICVCVFPLGSASTIGEALFIFDIQDFIWLRSLPNEYVHSSSDGKDSSYGQKNIK